MTECVQIFMPRCWNGRHPCLRSRCEVIVAWEFESPSGYKYIYIVVPIKILEVKIREGIDEIAEVHEMRSQ